MGDIKDKIIEQYKKGFMAIKDLGFKTLKENRYVSFKYKGEEISIFLPKETVILDCDEELFVKWNKVVYIVDQEVIREPKGYVSLKIDEFLESFN